MIQTMSQARPREKASKTQDDQYEYQKRSNRVQKLPRYKNKIKRE
jgi:hypothetical protein